MLIIKQKLLDFIDQPITLSMGITTFGNYKVDNIHMILKSADKAVYKAKKQVEIRHVYKGSKIN